MSGLLYGCDNGMNTIALAIGVPLMNVVAVGIRFWTRRRQDSKIGIDDWWALAALILLIALGAELLVAALNQVLSCPQPQNELALLAAAGPFVSRAAWAFFVTSVVNVGLVKIVFLYCMRRVFCTGEKGTLFSRVTYSMMALTALWTFGFMTAMVVINVNWGQPDQGSPSEWARTPATYETDKLFFAMTVSDVILDGIIAFLPLMVIWRLSLSVGRKLAISGIFALRLLALATSIIRMIYTVMFAQWMDDVLSVDPDLTDPEHFLIGTNLNTQMIWWTMFEVGFGLFASCITTIQFLMRREHIECAIDKIRSVFGLPLREHRRPSVTPRTSMGEVSHERSPSKRTRMYDDDTESTISAEYMVGSVRPSLEKSSISAIVEARHGYTRKSSSASLSVTEEEPSVISYEDHTSVGQAV